MTLGNKLKLAIAAMLTVVVGMTVSALYSINVVDRELEPSAGSTAEKLALTGDVKASANIMRTGQRGLLLNALQRDPAGAAATERDYSRKKEDTLSLVAKIDGLLGHEEGRQLVQQFESDIERHAACFRQIAEFCQAGKLDQASAFYKEQGAPAGAAMERTASALMTQETAIMRQSANAGRGQARFAMIAMTAIGTFGIGTLLVTLVLVGGITKTISHLAAQLSQGASQVLAKRAASCKYLISVVGPAELESATSTVSRKKPSIAYRQSCCKETTSAFGVCGITAGNTQELHIVRELCGKKIHWLGRVGSFPFFPVQARGFC